MINARLVGAVLILIVALSLFGGGFYLGGQHAKTKEQQTVIKSQIKQDKEVEKVQKAQVKRQIVYLDRLKVVHDATDNCLNVTAPDSVLRALRASSP